jgi:hypothetical protein
MPAKYAYLLIGFVFAACVCYAAVESYQKQITKASACENSHKLLAVLQFAPYRLRAIDLAPIVPTLNNICGVDVSFFETDGRETERFSLEVEIGGAVITGTSVPERQRPSASDVLALCGTRHPLESCFAVHRSHTCRRNKLGRFPSNFA